MKYKQYYVCPVEVFSDQALTPEDKLVFMLINSFCLSSRNGSKHFTVEYISKVTGVSKSNVFRSISNLLEKEYLNAGKNMSFTIGDFFRRSNKETKKSNDQPQKKAEKAKCVTTSTGTTYYELPDGLEIEL